MPLQYRLQLVFVEYQDCFLLPMYWSILRIKEVMNTNNLINIGVVILAVTLGYLVYEWTHKPEIVTQTVALTNFEKQKIIQQARLGWIPADSVRVLLNRIKLNSAIKINWIDSLIIKDSVNVKDSIVYTYVSYPVYEADSTFTAEKTDSVQNSSAKVVMTLKQRFLPLQEMFASEFQIDSLLINTWHIENKNLFDHIKFGPGISIDVDGKIKPTVSII